MRISAEKRRAIIALCREGKSNWHISRALSVSKTTAGVVRSEAGLPPYRKPPIWDVPPEDLARLTELRMAGYTAEEILPVMGWTLDRYRLVIRNHSLPRRTVYQIRAEEQAAAAKAKSRAAPAASPVEPDAGFETGPVVFVSASGIRAVRQPDRPTLPFISVLHGHFPPAVGGAPATTSSP